MALHKDRREIGACCPRRRRIYIHERALQYLVEVERRQTGSLRSTKAPCASMLNMPNNRVFEYQSRTAKSKTIQCISRRPVNFCSIDRGEQLAEQMRVPHAKLVSQADPDSYIPKDRTSQASGCPRNSCVLVVSRLQRRVPRRWELRTMDGGKSERRSLPSSDAHG